MPLGTFLLMVALISAGISIVGTSYGSFIENTRYYRIGRYATYVAAGATGTALALLFYYFLTDNFAIAYVAQNSMIEQSILYKISGVWGGQAGSLLLWASFLAVFGAVVVRTKRQSKLVGYATSIIMATLVFFLVLMNGTSNPFLHSVDLWNLPRPPTDGTGLNPMLRNPGMFVHPPTLYAGYAGIVVPFAFAISGLLTRDDDWVDFTRRWTVFSWVFLGIGILVGGWWAYVILGWGGYWAWDPVENASLLPWLTATAFLHSVMIQEKRGGFKIWNQVLIILTYLLTIYGVFLTRSGIIESVHSFSEGNMGIYLVAFIGVVGVLSVGLLAYRWEYLRLGEELSQSYFSKEVSFLLNNLALLVVAFVVWWGTSYPFLSELFLGKTVNIGTSFYNQLTPPFAIGLLFVMGVCPLIPWQRASLPVLRRRFSKPLIGSVLIGVLAFLLTTALAAILLTVVSFVALTHVQDMARIVRTNVDTRGEETVIDRMSTILWKNRRRFGGYVVHFGVLLLIVGIAWSSMFAVADTQAYSMGESSDVPGEYTVKLTDFQRQQVGAHTEEGPVFSVFSDGEFVRKVQPTLNEYPNSENTLSDPVIFGNLQRDMYFIYKGTTEGQAVLKVKRLPFVKLIWVGGMTLVVGGIFAIWPAFNQRENGSGPNDQDRPYNEGDIT